MLGDGLILPMTVFVQRRIVGELISLDGNPRSASAVRFGRTTQNTSFELIAWEWGPKPIQEFQQIFKNGPPLPRWGLMRVRC